MSTGFYQKKYYWEGPHYFSAESGWSIEIPFKVTWGKAKFEKRIFQFRTGWGQYTNYYFNYFCGLSAELKPTLSGGGILRGFRDASSRNGVCFGIKGGATVGVKVELGGDIGIKYQTYTASSPIGPYIPGPKDWTQWHGAAGGNVQAHVSLVEGLVAYVRLGPIYSPETGYVDRHTIDVSARELKIWFGGEIFYEVGTRKYKIFYSRDTTLTKGFHQGHPFLLGSSSSG